jgi:putative acetyltransferase
LAFGQPAEAHLVDALRQTGAALYSWVAVLEGRVVGHVIFSRLLAHDGPVVHRGLALAPLAVYPQWQRQGIGSQLVEQSLAMARQQHEPFVVVLGDPAYYSRFGFSVELATVFESPYAGPHLQALELRLGGLSGVRGQLKYCAPFSAF